MTVGSLFFEVVFKSDTVYHKLFWQRNRNTPKNISLKVTKYWNHYFKGRNSTLLFMMLNA